MLEGKTVLPEYGQFALILALCLSVAQGVLPTIGLIRKDLLLQRLAVSGARSQWLFVSIAFAILTYSFLSNDFSVVYVANHSSTRLPWLYRLSAVWGAHEGSMLLWLWV